MAEVRCVLQQCDPALLDPALDQWDCEAGRMLLHLTDSRRVQKVLLRQLFVLDAMMSLLEGLQSARQLMTLPCPPHPDGRARHRWKGLKMESRSGGEETETLLQRLLEKIQQINTKRQTLTQLIAQLHSKKQQCEQLQESLQKAQNALQSCERQLLQLEAESAAALCQLTGWQRIRDKLQAYVSEAQDVMQINLLSFSQSELRVELSPRPPTPLSSIELEPLQLSLTWSHDDRFTLQGSECLLRGPVLGGRSTLSAALLDLLQNYMGQFLMLSEIQGLRSSFAIDWCPAERRLVFLKSALLVCELQVEEGYPERGVVRLQSVRRDGNPVDTSALQPLSDLSLTNWLVFLHRSPLL
ncbi:hypothetical protein PBY51_008433 [Eleginops maclovinus]|uniref:Uncharacterized protein n=1 Tax=Eleginops maclovinus TaxID=56733 RepID=A0AAN8AIY1_ELEMC|nr:hypothetical protein PBY51_008433 [Eleginops maclovinus]